MIDLHSSTDPELAAIAQVLARFDRAATDAGVDYLVVGATAQTLLAVGLMGREAPRATRDIDIAAAVGSWEHFQRLAARLEKRGSSPQAFSVGGVEVDVLPYGGVEDADRTILWPDDHRMNVRGFREAVESAETVRLPGVTVQVPSIPGLALLKLVAWSERRTTTSRDAVDLGNLVGWYASGDRLDRLFDEKIDLLERYDFDSELAGACALGSDMVQPLDVAGSRALLRIVEDDAVLNRLAVDSGRPQPRWFAVARAVRDGMQDGAAR